MDGQRPFERLIVKDIDPEFLRRISERINHYTIAFLRSHDRPVPTQYGTAFS
jgi:hypothetical protein